MIGRAIARLLGRASAHLRRERTLVRIGGLSLALAFGVAFVPRLFPESVFRPLSRVLAGSLAIGSFGLVVGVLAALALRELVPGADGENARARRERRDDRWVPKPTPERAHYDEHRTAGDEIDSVFGADPEDRRDLGTRRATAAGRVREVAIAAVADAENCGTADAARRIDAGTWTDDPRAAAFLGGSRHAPLRIRIRDWASGDGYERWATHAVAEVEALTDGEGRR